MGAVNVGENIRNARATLGWSAQKLGDTMTDRRGGLPRVFASSVLRIEGSPRVPQLLPEIVAALQAGGWQGSAGDLV